MHATKASPLIPVVAVACALAAVAGLFLATERFITPERGLGYALGIAGGSAMLLLLAYPARKRIGLLAGAGSVRFWFELHMALGLLGPLLVLYHANFSLGATNSNVALVCMLVVSTSGVAGRYFYSRIHLGLHGRKATLADLQADSESVRTQGRGIVLPGLADRLDLAEARLQQQAARQPALLLPLWAGWQVRRQRRELLAWVATQASGRPAAADAATLHELSAARLWVSRRLAAARKVVEFSAYERLFALWHVLHLPLFLMLLLAGIVHVFSVHIY